LGPVAGPLAQGLSRATPVGRIAGRAGKVAKRAAKPGPNRRPDSMDRLAAASAADDAAAQVSTGRTKRQRAETAKRGVSRGTHPDRIDRTPKPRGGSTHKNRVLSDSDPF
jgi:hypothetical protein